MRIATSNRAAKNSVVCPAYQACVSGPTSGRFIFSLLLHFTVIFDRLPSASRLSVELLPYCFVKVAERIL